MGDINSAPINFSRVFEVDGARVLLEFVNMNITKKSLFQVYIPYQDRKIRIHLQLKDGIFKITVPEICPPAFRAMEAQMGEAIIES